MRIFLITLRTGSKKRYEGNHKSFLPVTQSKALFNLSCTFVINVYKRGDAVLATNSNNSSTVSKSQKEK